MKRRVTATKPDPNGIIPYTHHFGDNDNLHVPHLLSWDFNQRSQQPTASPNISHIPTMPSTSENQARASTAITCTSPPRLAEPPQRTNIDCGLSPILFQDPEFLSKFIQLQSAGWNAQQFLEFSSAVHQSEQPSHQAAQSHQSWRQRNSSDRAVTPPRNHPLRSPLPVFDNHSRQRNSSSKPPSIHNSRTFQPSRNAPIGQPSKTSDKDPNNNNNNCNNTADQPDVPLRLPSPNDRISASLLDKEVLRALHQVQSNQGPQRSTAHYRSANSVGDTIDTRPASATVPSHPRTGMPYNCSRSPNSDQLGSGQNNSQHSDPQLPSFAPTYRMNSRPIAPMTAPLSTDPASIQFHPSNLPARYQQTQHQSYSLQRPENPAFQHIFAPPPASASGYSSIEILRESKHVSDFMRPGAASFTTTSGIFHPERQHFQQQQPLLNQSDAVDHHFRMALNNHAASAAVIANNRANCHKQHLQHYYMPPPSAAASISAQSYPCVSSCSSSSSLSSMAVGDVLGVVSQPPQRYENMGGGSTSGHDPCKFSLKKRLLQRYQADAGCSSSQTSTSGNAETASPLQNNQQVVGETSNQSEKNEPPTLNVTPSGHFESSSSPVSNPPIVNSAVSLIAPQPTEPSTVVKPSSTPRRHPPVRASKLAPAMGSLNVGTTSKRSRTTKQSIPAQFARNRVGGNLDGREANPQRAKASKPRFYNSRAISEDPVSPGGPCSMIDRVPSDFDFNGQDDDEDATAASLESENRTVNNKLPRKRRTAPSVGSNGKAKVPRKSLVETSRKTRPQSQRKNVLNAVQLTYAEDEGDEFGEEYFNDDDAEKTIRAEEPEDEDEASICQKCKINIKPLQTSSRPDRYDFQCSEEKISLEEILKRLHPLPELGLLSHRSLCGGDVDAASHKPGQSFLQLTSCTELEKFKPSARCRACREAFKTSGAPTVETSFSSTSAVDAKARRRTARNQSDGTDSTSSNTVSAAISVFCRFWGFRKLVYDGKGVLSSADFCRTSEADFTDRALWAMHQEVTPALSYSHAMHLIDRLGSVACRLLLTELSVLSSVVDPTNPAILQCSPHASGELFTTPSRLIAWKRPVQGVREMCDVCETTIFNAHWVCGKCGYSVCCACYYTKSTTVARRNKALLQQNTLPQSSASSNHFSVAPEDIKGLAPSIIQLGFEDFTVRHSWSTCSASRRSHDPAKMMVTSLLPYGSVHSLWHRLHRIFPRLDCPCGKSSGNMANAIPKASSSSSSTTTSAATSSLDLLADLALKSTGGSPEIEDGTVEGGRSAVHQKAGSSSCVLYLSDGDPKGTQLKAFQRHWATNQPVVISDCGQRFNASLWAPSSLIRDSDLNANPLVLIDCETNLVIPRYPIRTFWDVFGSAANTKRMIGKDGSRTLHHLKIREWPASGDLSEAFPDRYANYAANLPIPEYTHRDGSLNLASRLPNFFVRPDLGPRLQVAHDLTLQPKIGTVNIRVDVTDVFNVLMHISRPPVDQTQTPTTEPKLAAFLEKAGLDSATITDLNLLENVSLDRGLPGALWHIFKPSDLPVLRDYLTKLDRISGSPASQEYGAQGPSVVNSDIIHDQRVYLSIEQLDDLRVETGIKPFTVLQFLGNGILIPAGSVYQVRTLGHCVNVSSDFISPEHVLQCLELTEEYRHLPRNHPAHEDKLQVKNMIYHTVKDALSVVLKEELSKSACCAAVTEPTE